MKNIKFINKVVKQGNSLCVRIPNNVKNQLKLEENEEVIISITPQKTIYKYNEETVREYLKITSKIKELKKYPEVKQRLFIALNFKFIEETSIKDPKKRVKKQIEFIKKNKKEFGPKLIEEFLKWATIIKEKAFITEKDGSLVMKNKYNTEQTK